MIKEEVRVSNTTKYGYDLIICQMYNAIPATIILEKMVPADKAFYQYFFHFKKEEEINSCIKALEKLKDQLKTKEK